MPGGPRYFQKSDLRCDGNQGAEVHYSLRLETTLEETLHIRRTIVPLGTRSLGGADSEQHCIFWDYLRNNVERR
jgi:hypothetical protein